MENITVDLFAYSLIIGFLPAFIWLIFWLQEDEHPEPSGLLVAAFVGGFFAVPIAGVIQLIVQKSFVSISSINLDLFSKETIFMVAIIYFIYAFIEEYAKYYMVKHIIFWRKEFDEPVDAIVYMITGALGFAAVENTLYLLNTFPDSIQLGLLTGQLRFIGATLLHAISSGILGYFIASAFFKNRLGKRVALALGLLFATALHTLFNLLILITEGFKIEPTVILITIAGLILICAFDKIKHNIKYTYAKR